MPDRTDVGRLIREYESLPAGSAWMKCVLCRLKLEHEVT